MTLPVCNDIRQSIERLLAGEDVVEKINARLLLRGIGAGRQKLAV